MKMQKILALTLVLPALALALACSGGSGGATPAKKAVLRLSGGLSSDVVSAYYLDGAGEGTLAGRANYQPATDSADLSLDTSRSYRITVAINGVELLETIVLSEDFTGASGGVLDLGAINAATTYLSILADESGMTDRDFLASEGIHSLVGMSLAEAAAALDKQALGEIRLLAVAIGMMTRASAESAHTQAQWDAVEDALFSAFRDSGSGEARYEKAKAVVETMSRNILITTPFTITEMGSLKDLFPGRTDADVSAYIEMAQVFDVAVVILAFAESGAYTLDELMAGGKAALEGHDQYKAYHLYRAASFFDRSHAPAQLFAAALRVAVIPLRQDNMVRDMLAKAHTETVKDADGDYHMDTSVLDDPDSYDTAPTMQDMKSFAAEFLISEIKGAIDDLNHIDANSFATTVSKGMQGYDVTSDLVVDGTDVKAVLAGLHCWKAYLSYALAVGMDLSGKTDTAAAMKQFLMNLDDNPMWTGSSDYQNTMTLTGGMAKAEGGRGAAVVNTLSFDAGYPGEVEVTIAGSGLPDLTIDGDIGPRYHYSAPNPYEFHGHRCTYQSDGGRVCYDLYGAFSASAFNEYTGSLNITTSAGQSYSYAYFSLAGTRLSGTLNLNAAHDPIEQNEWPDILNANPSAGTLNPEAAAEARDDFRKALGLAGEVLDELQADKAAGADRSNNLVENLSQADRGNGAPFTDSDINGFGTFLSGARDSLAGPAQVEPSVFSPAFKSAVIDLSIIFSRTPRDFLTGDDGLVLEDAAGEVDEDVTETEALRQQIAGPHLFGQSGASLKEEFEEFGEYFSLLFDGLEAPGYIYASTYSGMLSWHSVDNADLYNVYYAKQSGVTPSNYQSLAGGGRHQTTATRVYLSSDLGLLGSGTYFLTVAAQKGDFIGTPCREYSAAFSLPGAPATLSFNSTTQLFSAYANNYGAPLTWNFGDGSTPLTTNVVSGHSYPNASQKTISVYSPDGFYQTAAFSVAASSIAGTFDASPFGSSLLELFVNDNQIASLDLSGNPALVKAYLGYNSSLSGLNIANNPNLVELSLTNCSFGQAAVDSILAQLTANGKTGGTVNLTGGSNAVPSSTGLANKATLESRGWTVMVNLP